MRPQSGLSASSIVRRCTDDLLHTNSGKVPYVLRTDSAAYEKKKRGFVQGATMFARAHVLLYEPSSGILPTTFQDGSR